MLLLLISRFALAASDGGGLPVKTPKAVGMSSERLAKIDHVVERGISAGGYPGASVVVGRRGAAVWEKGFGRLSWEQVKLPRLADRTIYDLASLTKVVGTTTALMVLYDEGKIRSTIRSRSTSRSSRAATRIASPFACSSSIARASRLAATSGASRTPPKKHAPRSSPTPLGCEPGRCYEYSDLGADMLGFVVEAASGEPLDQFLQERVFGPARHERHVLPPRRLAQVAHRAHGDRARRAATRSGAKCTTRTPSRSAASPVTLDCSAPPPISPCSRR